MAEYFPEFLQSIPNWVLIAFTLLVLLSVFTAFVMERFSPHLVALTGMVALLAVGAISTDDMLGVFSSSAPITIACMFVISAALDHTGVVDYLGQGLLNISSKNQLLGIVSMILFVLVISAFMNNTPVVIILTPVIIGLAEKLKRFPSKYLIPLSYASIMGGTCTLIGTSTNILVNSVAQANGHAAFHMFDIAIPGMVMAAGGLLFMGLFGRFLLPERMPSTQEYLGDRPSKRFLSEAIIPIDSPLIGKSLNEVKFTEREGYEVIDLIRKEVGSRMGLGQVMDLLLKNIKGDEDPKKAPASAFRDIPLEAGDRLVFKLDKDEIIELQQHIGIEFDPKKAHISEPMPTKKIVVVEGVIPPTSNFIGKRIRDLRLRRAYGCFIVALHRQEKNITGDLPNIVIKDGDSLVLEGVEEDIDRLFRNEQIHNASHFRGLELDKRKAPIAMLAILGVVLLSALGIMPIAGLAMIGAVAVVLTKCVTMEHAYRTIDWRILLLIFGMLGIGKAMENTGAASMLVDQAVGFLDGFGPVIILAAVYFLTSALTEVVTNNAVAILLTPIVISLATTLGYSPTPFIVAVMFGSSASFATPIGYQTNTFVYAAGGYKFNDFLRIGIPMNILMWISATLLIPLFWPF